MCADYMKCNHRGVNQHCPNDIVITQQEMESEIQLKNLYDRQKVDPIEYRNLRNIQLSNRFYCAEHKIKCFKIESFNS